MEKEQVRDALQRIVGKDNVLWKDVDLTVYSYDAGLVKGRAGMVAFVDNVDQVAQIVKLLYKEGMSYVARGSGTNLTGGTVPMDGGVVIEFARMNHILEIDLENERITVEPGIYNLTVQSALAEKGYYYAPDPASQKAASMGGNLGGKRGGPHCLKYGVTSNHVLGAEVVLPNGEVTWIGGKALDAPGPDLMGLLVGAEGTLGIVTENHLPHHEKPRAGRHDACHL